ncbi:MULTISPECIES: hypothetical protein [unclassified Gilliamella]|uniref:hypothetical protein n=1 Tax=unclassified Gilliamella TaxID=2685620 RepID=UPI00130ACD3C|nr:MULTISPECIES: hypothetical protein [unclassified Gilliamella]MWP48471.1 hypothetical protein [Gilliamella sp. Lep-s35]MWP68250.1 hypothetical protein [Gilliamella sp. Lep-s5]MWP76611.1 hypothetical protein [Gilliamella sp. Lep-s21]
MPIPPKNKSNFLMIILVSILFWFSYSSWHLSNLLLSPALTCHSAHSTSELTTKHESISQKQILILPKKTVMSACSLFCQCLACSILDSNFPLKFYISSGSERYLPINPISQYNEFIPELRPPQAV